MMEKDYEKYSDDELILRLRDGEAAITDYIMDKYKNLVRNKAKSMYILGADREDLIQEGMIGLFKAVRDYDTGRDASFFTFADLCISRQMYTAVLHDALPISLLCSQRAGRSTRPLTPIFPSTPTTRKAQAKAESGNC